MCSMVKLQDFVDLTEPPWWNLVETSTSGWSWDEVMDRDTKMAKRDEEVVELQTSPDETNMGLG